MFEFTLKSEFGLLSGKFERRQMCIFLRRSRELEQKSQFTLLLISRKNNSDITEMISETGRHNFNLWLNYSFKECLYPWFLLTVRFDFSFLRLSDFKDFTSLCYLWLVQINFTLLNCSREDLCCHSFGLDPLCKQLTCATVKTPHEQARMDRRDRPRGGAVRIHQNLWTPSVTMETAERVGVAGCAEDRWTHPTSCHDIKHLCWCSGQTFFFSFCSSISPWGP